MQTPALDGAALDELTRTVRGTIIRPEDDAYDSARKVWNGMIDRRPALIVRCAGAADVMQCVRFARATGALVAVRGGAHSVAGNAVCEGGIVIDLSGMKGVRVDAERRTARAGPGTTWGDYDHETQAFGLASPGGLVSTTGIAGLTLGGGIGWLLRKYGLACDNLLSVDMVTADGRLVRASVDENPDLFWGIRGAGANFGVVTSFEYRLHALGPLVLAGLLLYPLEAAPDLLRYYRGYVETAPDELTTVAVLLTAPPAPFVPEPLRSKPAAAIALMYAGAVEEGEKELRTLRAFGPPAADLVQPMPYVVMQRMLDETAPPGLLNYWKSEALDVLGDDAIETMVSHAASMPSPLSHIDVHHAGGALVAGVDGETAFGHRHAHFIVNVIGMWTQPSESKQQIAWIRGLWESLRPPGGGGTYVNFLAEDEGEERVRSAYGAVYQRLSALKRTYDPENLFRVNQNIKPEEGARSA